MPLVARLRRGKTDGVVRLREDKEGHAQRRDDHVAPAVRFTLEGRQRPVGCGQEGLTVESHLRKARRVWCGHVAHGKSVDLCVLIRESQPSSWKATHGRSWRVMKGPNRLHGRRLSGQDEVEPRCTCAVRVHRRAAQLPTRFRHREVNQDTHEVRRSHERWYRRSEMR